MSEVINIKDVWEKMTNIKVARERKKLDDSIRKLNEEIKAQLEIACQYDVLDNDMLKVEIHWPLGPQLKKMLEDNWAIVHTIYSSGKKEIGAIIKFPMPQVDVSEIKPTVEIIDPVKISNTIVRAHMKHKQEQLDNEIEQFNAEVEKEQNFQAKHGLNISKELMVSIDWPMSEELIALLKGKSMSVNKTRTGFKVIIPLEQE